MDFLYQLGGLITQVTGSEAMHARLRPVSLECVTGKHCGPLSEPVPPVSRYKSAAQFALHNQL